MDWTETAKRHRKYIQSHFQSRNLPLYNDVQTKEIHHLLNDFADDPVDFENHIERCVLSSELLSADLILCVSQSTERYHDDASIPAKPRGQ